MTDAAESGETPVWEEIPQETILSESLTHLELQSPGCLLLHPLIMMVETSLDTTKRRNWSVWMLMAPEEQKYLELPNIQFEPMKPLE